MSSPAPSSKPVLGYWNIRGLCHSIRLLLKYAGTDYEDRRYEFGPAPDFNKDTWMREKFNLGLDFPNLPYWIQGNVKLTESKAILKYVAKTKAPALLPATPQLQTYADMLDGVIGDTHRSLINYAYAPDGKDLPEVTNATRFEQLSQYLSRKRWLLGDKISYIDFYLAEVLSQFKLYKEDILKEYPTLRNYLQRFENLPELKQYIPANKKLTAYSPHATIFF